MAKKNHYRLLNEKHLESSSKVEFNYGFGKKDEDEKKEPNYYYMARSLQTNLNRFEEDITNRHSQRIEELEIPVNIDYVLLDFMDQFDIKEYYNKWYNDFGLEAVDFFNFGRTALFAIIEKDKFKLFINNIKSFIDFGVNKNEEATYSEYITYVKAFKLLTTADIISFKNDSLGNLVNLNLVELPLDLEIQQALTKRLVDYLTQKNFSFSLDEDVNKFEIRDISYDDLKLIADNFDIIKSITCSLSSTVKPSTLNTLKRDYGFSIDNPDESLPIIGIIDTGISLETPIAPIVIDDNTFTLSGNPLIDISGNWQEGHGTAVAALAALGRKVYEQDFSGKVKADAKLLSIKLFDNGEGYLSESAVIKLLYSVKHKYPEIEIFVLTIGYKRFKANNESFSNYTYELDKFAHETGSLIFISTGNNDNAVNDNTDYSINYFLATHTNLCTPADSMNNVVVGAAAEALNQGNFFGISLGREYPTLYSRKSHVDLSSLYPKNKGNKNYFKPDIIESGGDYEFYNANTITTGDKASMRVLSANPAEGFYRHMGTSFSAPLVANLAAQLRKTYPSLKIQTLKALILNGASTNNIRLAKENSKLLNKIAGYGYVDPEDTLYSNENKVTFILEDIISDDEMKIYPISFPEYLVKDDLGKKNGILKVRATLCFSFLPVLNNQLSYCPVHLAFCFFKNQTATEIKAKNHDTDGEGKQTKTENYSLLKSTLNWTQAGRHITKPIPFSNSQKLNFKVNVKDLVDEDGTFKLAVQCRLTTQLLPSILEKYSKEFNFSLAVTLHEDLQENTGKLYDEMALVNSLEIIQEVDLEGTIEV